MHPTTSQIHLTDECVVKVPNTPELRRTKSPAIATSRLAPGKPDSRARLIKASGPVKNQFT